MTAPVVDTANPVPANPAGPPLAPVPSTLPTPLLFGLPGPQRWTRRAQLLSGAGVLLGLVIAAGLYLLIRDPFRRVRTDLVTHRVRHERLELTIVERGALEAAKNSDIYCTVKAGARGGTISTTIKWVIDDGSSVKKGDLIVNLDDAGLQDQLKQQKIVVDNSAAENVKAEEDYKIQLSQNESDIKTAEVNFELAQIDLRKYQEGDYPQQLKIFEGNIKQAESDVEQQRDRAAWANRMVKKGYLTVTQAQGEQSKLESLLINLAKAVEDKRVLTDPVFGTGKRQTTFLRNNVAEARRALERVKSQAAAREAQSRSAREAKKSVHQQELTKFKEIEAEINKCKIHAPQDGMVVYFVPEQARFGGGAQQAIVAQGEPVREGQKLMQIPNLRHMLVNTKVHEALVSRVRRGQPALVRVDSFPDQRLPARVETVATVSSQQDFMSADVKVYTTKVRIDGAVEGLKPGMSAEVTITVGAALENVLAVPIQAIIGSAELGQERKCFVLTADGPQERAILVGQSNERLAEIKQGLYEGAEVVLNPRALVGDTARTRQAPDRIKGDLGPLKAADEAMPADQGQPAPVPEKKSAARKEGGASALERQQQIEKFRQATPLQRQQMLESVPEAYRERFKEKLEALGIMVK